MTDHSQIRSLANSESAGDCLLKWASRTIGMHVQLSCSKGPRPASKYLGSNALTTMLCNMQIVYEAYGAGGTGFIMECLTDNVNRSATGTDWSLPFISLLRTAYLLPACHYMRCIRISPFSDAAQRHLTSNSSPVRKKHGTVDGGSCVLQMCAQQL